VPSAASDKSRAPFRAKRKSGRKPALVLSARDELLGPFVPSGDRRGDVVGVEPLVDFLPGRLGECGVHPAHNLVHHIGVDVLEVILRKTVRHRVLINPALVFSRGVGLATRHASREASGVPRPVKVERRRQKQKSSTPRGGLCNFRDLERVGCSLPWEEGEEQKVV